MIVTRLRQISLLLIAMAISALAFIQMFQRTAGEFPMQYAGMLALAVVLFLVLWGLIVRFQPYASQSILPCVLLLTATGVTMIARIDQSEGWTVAQRQLIWLCIAIVLSALLIIFLKDYRVLRRFSYVSMVVGLVLLLAPMLRPLWAGRRAHLDQDSGTGPVPAGRVRQAVPCVLLRRLPVRPSRPAGRGR